MRRSMPTLVAAGSLALAVVAAGGAMWSLPALSAGQAVRIPAPAVDEAPSGRSETAVFAGGCFWGVQGVFQHVKGVTSAVSGYTGGTAATARYERVSDGDTGHAESVRVTFDPRQISYGKLLQIHFSVIHDPTQLNRQGPDSGTQYRSAVFPQSAGQKRVADAYIAQLGAAKAYPRPIVTQVARGQAFFPAEGYHQDYLTLHPHDPYITYNDLPKVAVLRQLFPDYYRAQPVLAGKRQGA
jgi:peptide-methionine (S)-S-oxide reductase